MIAIGSTSYFFLSIASISALADRIETSCSPDWPPKITPKRSFFANCFPPGLKYRLAECRQWPETRPTAVGVALGGLLGSARTTPGRPTTRPRHFPGAGITILSSDLESGPEIWCRCDAGPLGFLAIAAHGHADALSVEVRHGGVEILVDPGTYCYHGEPEWRSYFRSTRAHNMLELDGTSQAVEAGPFMWSSEVPAQAAEVHLGSPTSSRGGVGTTATHACRALPRSSVPCASTGPRAARGGRPGAVGRRPRGSSVLPPGARRGGDPHRSRAPCWRGPTPSDPDGQPCRASLELPAALTWSEHRGRDRSGPGVVLAALRRTRAHQHARRRTGTASAACLRHEPRLRPRPRERVMAEQVDLRSVASLIRRRRRCLRSWRSRVRSRGVALVTWRPPLYSSTSKVLLPAGPVLPSGEQSSWEASTQVSIARSDAVLGPAAEAVSPPLSRREIRSLVEITAPTSDVLVIVARGATSGAAEALAKEVAESAVAYQTEATSSLSNAELALLRTRRDALQSTLDTVEDQAQRTTDRVATADPESLIGRRDASALAQLTVQQTDLVLEINELENKIQGATGNASARVIEGAAPADRPLLVVWYLVAAVAMALLAALLGILALLMLTRRDAKLGTRDEISDAVGSAVIASLRSHTPAPSRRGVPCSRATAQVRPRVGRCGRPWPTWAWGSSSWAGPSPATVSTPPHTTSCASSAWPTMPEPWPWDPRSRRTPPRSGSRPCSCRVRATPRRRSGPRAPPNRRTRRCGPTCASPRGAVRSVRPSLTVLVTALDRRTPSLPRLEREAGRPARRLVARRLLRGPGAGGRGRLRVGLPGQRSARRRPGSLGPHDGASTPPRTAAAGAAAVAGHRYPPGHAA